MITVNKKRILALVTLLALPLVAAGCFGGQAQALGNWGGPAEAAGFVHAVGNGAAQRISAADQNWEQSWQISSATSYGAVYGTPVSDDDKLYFAGYTCSGSTCNAGVFSIPLDAADSGNINTTTVEARVVGQLGISGDTLLVPAGRLNDTASNNGTLYAYSTANLVRIGSLEFDGELIGGVTVVGDTAYLGSLNGNVYAIDVSDPANMRIVWEHAAGSAVAAKPVVVDDTVYIGVFADDDNFLALDTADGRRRWSFSSGAWIWAEAELSEDGNTIYIADFDGNVNALRTATGEPLWTEAAQVPGGVVAKPELVSTGNRTYLAVGLASPNNNNESGAHIVDTQTGRVTGERFQTANGVGIFAPPLAIGDKLYVLSQRGELRTYSALNFSQQRCFNISDKSFNCQQ